MEGALVVPDRLFKVILVGNSSVGKTALLRRFCEGRFQRATSATVGEYQLACPINTIGNIGRKDGECHII